VPDSRYVRAVIRVYRGGALTVVEAQRMHFKVVVLKSDRDQLNHVIAEVKYTSAVGTCALREEDDRTRLYTLRLLQLSKALVESLTGDPLRELDATSSLHQLDGTNRSHTGLACFLVDVCSAEKRTEGVNEP